MSNTITLKINATINEESIQIDIENPSSVDEIREQAIEEWNDANYDPDNEESIEATQNDTILLEVADWDETPEKLRELDNDFFEFVEHYKDSNYDADVFEAAYNLDIPFSQIDEAYQGSHSTDQDFAKETAEQLGTLDKNASWPMNCIDWEYAAKELMYDYSSDNGHYFRNL